MELLIITFIAVFITIVGALPFGLVNLSVLDTSYRNGTTSAMQLSHGAAIVEVLFGLLALTAGGLIAHVIRSNPVIYYLVLAVPAIAGVFFLLKGKYKQPEDTGKSQGFFR
jgi:threonine/homoserine/homoserine lactone efflux protein